jgi:predicted transcriptional regulator
MNAWNTINALSAKPLSKALFVLETMSTDLSISILEYLKKNHTANLLDLTIHLGIDSSSIESQLDLLSTAGIVQQRSNLYATSYCLNKKKIKQVRSIAKQLCDGRIRK